MPAASARAPNIGPRIAPKTAAPKAVPISSPRRSRGVTTVSQASAPAQVTVLDTPWSNRARPSAHGPLAKAKPKLASASRPRPITTARFGPYRAAARPPGIPPISAPAPNPRPAVRRRPWRARTRSRTRARRRQDAEQHRVDEDDDADEEEEPAHGPTLCRTKNSASRVRFRPPPQRTFGFRLRPTEWTRPTRVPCSLQGGI